VQRSAGSRKRGIVALVLVISLVGTAGASLAAGPWPDGEWYGFISGGGIASGTLTTDDGSSEFGSGSAVASGLFFLEIVDGEPKGDYGITWQGQGSSASGSATQRIDELGIIEGSDGIPILVRESASGSTTVDGVNLPFSVPNLGPAPTPLRGEFADCQVVEGSFVGKLSALGQALEAFGFKVAAEETFSAYRVFGEDPADKEFISKQIEKLNDVTNGFGQLITDVKDIGLGQAIRDAEALLVEAEVILTELRGIPECDGVDTEGFSLGISRSVEFFVQALLLIATEQLDGKAIANLAALAGRAGVVEKISGFGMDAVMTVAPQAIFDKDLGTLDWLVAASIVYGDSEYAVFLAEEIAAIRGGS